MTRAPRGTAAWTSPGNLVFAERDIFDLSAQPVLEPTGAFGCGIRHAVNRVVCQKISVGVAGPRRICLQFPTAIDTIKPAPPYGENCVTAVEYDHLPGMPRIGGERSRI
jgi:hypothetical protein